MASLFVRYGSDGSRTITIEDPSHGSDDEAGSSGEPDGVLRLRGGPIHTDPRVRWEDGTVDNEFLNRKKSKSKFLTAPI